MQVCAKEKALKYCFRASKSEYDKDLSKCAGPNNKTTCNSFLSTRRQQNRPVL